MSRVLPILFNTEMVRAVMDGRKTVTRREIKKLPDNAEFSGWLLDSTVYEDDKDIGKAGFKVHRQPTEKAGCLFVRPPCQVGDILYVRETWQCLNPYSDKEYVYRASCDADYAKDIGKWHPSIHMPKEAARIWLKVTDVQVERLQDITAQQAEKEGMTEKQKSVLSMDEYWYWFKELWKSTIKKVEIDKYGWSSNPWVWVIEFERCEK